MTKSDLAWAGGFLDGEGCFQFVRSGGTYRGSIEVEQRNPTNLYVLQRILGGVGTVRPRRGRKAHRFRVTAGGEVLIVLQKVMPYLAFKYPEAQQLRRGLTTTDPRIEESCAKEIRRLKRR